MVKLLAHGLLYLSLHVNYGLNTLLLGSPHQTMSARAGQARAQGSAGGRRVCALLGWADLRDSADEDHCEKARRHEAERRGKLKK